jgi:hypothetical protein
MFSQNQLPRNTYSQNVMMIETIMSTHSDMLNPNEIFAELLIAFCKKNSGYQPRQRQVFAAQQILNILQSTDISISKQDKMCRVISLVNRLPANDAFGTSDLAMLLRVFLDFFPEYASNVNEELKKHLKFKAFSLTIQDIFQLLLKELNNIYEKYTSLYRKYFDFCENYASYIPKELKSDFLQVLLKSHHEYAVVEVIASLDDEEIVLLLTKMISNFDKAMARENVGVYFYVFDQFFDFIPSTLYNRMIDFTLNAIETCFYNNELVYAFAVLVRLAEKESAMLPIIANKTIKYIDYQIEKIFHSDFNRKYRQHVYQSLLNIYESGCKKAILDSRRFITDNEQLELLTELIPDIPDLKELFSDVCSSYGHYNIDKELATQTLGHIYRGSSTHTQLELNAIIQQKLDNCDSWCNEIRLACHNNQPTEFNAMQLSMLKSEFTWMVGRMCGESISLLNRISIEAKTELFELHTEYLFCDEENEAHNAILFMSNLLSQLPIPSQKSTLSTLISYTDKQSLADGEFIYWCEKLSVMVKNIDKENLQFFGFEIFHQAKCTRIIASIKVFIEEGKAKLKDDPEISYSETSGWIFSITRMVKNLDFFIPKHYFTIIIEMLFPFLYENSLGKVNTIKSLAGLIDYMSFELKQKFFEIFLDYLHDHSANKDSKDKRYHGYLPSFGQDFLLITLHKLSFQKNGAIDAIVITKIVKYLSLHTSIPVESYLSYFTDMPMLIDYFSHYAIIAIASKNNTDDAKLSYATKVIDLIIESSVKQEIMKQLDNDDIVNLVVGYGIR